MNIAVRRSAGNNKSKTYCGNIIHDRSFKLKLQILFCGILIKEIQFNPLKGQVDEIDFQALVSNEKVHSVAEIVLVNHDKLEAGVLQQHLEEISFRALPSALVDKVMVDVGDMKVGDVIKVKDLAIAQDKDVDLKTDLEAAVVSVAAVHVDPALEAEEEAAAEEEAK